MEAPALTAERQRLMAVVHHFMVALLDQLDLLNVPPPTFPPDTIALRAHLLHLLYPLPKGRLLIFRSLLRLSPPHTFALLFVLTSNLPTLCHPPQPTQMDEAFAQSIAEGLYTLPHSTVNLSFAQLIMAPPEGGAESAVESLVSVLRSKLGCMAVQVFIKKGQELYSLFQQQRPPPGVALSQSTLPPHLLALTRDLSLWESLTGELMKRLEGQWGRVLDLLPIPTQPTPATTMTARGGGGSGGKQGGSSQSPPAHLLVASARAMWDLLSQLLTHLSTPHPFAPPQEGQESDGATTGGAVEGAAPGGAGGAPGGDVAGRSGKKRANAGAGRDAALYDRLVQDLTPLFKRYLRSTYLDSPPPPPPTSTVPSPVISSPPSSSSTPSATPATFASVVTPAPPPVLLPALSSSLLSVAEVLLFSSEEDWALLEEAHKAQKASEDAVRAFISNKRRIKQQQHQHHYPPHQQHSSHPPSHSPHYQQTSRHHSSPSHSHPRSHFAAAPSSSSPMVRVAPPPVKSAPGSYAFIAAQKAAAPAVASPPASNTPSTQLSSNTGGAATAVTAASSSSAASSSPQSSTISSSPHSNVNRNSRGGGGGGGAQRQQPSVRSQQ